MAGITGVCDGKRASGRIGLAREGGVTGDEREDGEIRICRGSLDIIGCLSLAR